MKTSEYENPFGVKTNENYEYIITLGSQLASKETFKTKEEAEEYIEKKPWELIAIMAMAISVSVKSIDEEAIQTNTKPLKD